MRQMTLRSIILVTIVLIAMGILAIFIFVQTASAQELQPATVAQPIPLSGDWKLYWIPEEGLGEHTENRGCLLVTGFNEQSPQPSANAMICVPANNLQLQNTLVNCLGVNTQTAVCHVFIERSVGLGQGSFGNRIDRLLNNLAENGAGVFFFWDLHCSISISRNNYQIPPSISC